MKKLFNRLYLKFKVMPILMRIFLLAVSLFIVGSVSYKYWENMHPKDEIHIHGNVDIRQVDLGFRVAGRISEMRFEEGDLVKANDVISVLDKVPFQNEFNSQKAQVAQAQADLLKKRTGNRPEEIHVAEAVLSERQATLDNAIRTYERQKNLVKKGAASQQAYDDSVRQKEEAEARLKNARDTLQLIKEGFRSEDIQAAEATLELAKSKLAIAQTSLNDTEILSPSDGIIFSRVREAGAIVAPGTTVYTLALHEPVWIRAYVSESNLGRLMPGMEAYVTTDSHPKPFKGKVGFISPQAEFTPKTVETKELRTDLVYRIRVIVEDPKGELRQGMPVDVTLLRGANYP